MATEEENSSEYQKNNNPNLLGTSMNSGPDLPKDITSLLFEKLDFRDELNCRAVSLDWLKTAGLPCLPWLLVYDNEARTCNLIAPYRNGTRDAHIVSRLQVLDSEIVASKHGWLLIKRPSGGLLFHNIRTAFIVGLPDFATNISYEATFSSVPTCKDCIVFCIQCLDIEEKIKISVCKFNENVWTNFEFGCSMNSVKAVVYLNGAFYCLFDRGALRAFEVDTNEWKWLSEKPVEDKETILTMPVSFGYAVTNRVTNQRKLYMAEYEGDLLLVCTGHAFTVYRFSGTSMNWIELGSLDGAALFLGRTSYAAPATGGAKHLAERIYYGGEFYNWYYCYKTKCNKICTEMYDDRSLSLSVKRAWIKPFAY